MNMLWNLIILHSLLMSSSYQRAVRGQRSNLPVLIGLGIMVAGFASIPMMLRKSDDNKNLLLQDKALTGSQIQRGAYLNSGSKDAGPDPVRCQICFVAFLSICFMSLWHRIGT